MDKKEKICQIALSLTKGVGITLWKKLIAHFGCAQAIFQSSAEHLMNIPGSSKRLAYEILKKNTFRAAESLFLAHQQEQIQILSLLDSAYPKRLKDIIDAPPLLYCQGKIDLNAAKVLSIVGTRNATAYGKKMVEELISGLCAYNVLIVSGLAYGIDIHAHKTALQYGLSTLAVLAGSLDVIYPSSHKKIATIMRMQGGLLSEHPLNTPLAVHQFPARNRIMAGIADAAVIIEASHKSGALITADCANAYNREVFAVPGSIGMDASSGCNYLIKTQQAHLITSAADIAYIMNWEVGTSVVQPSKYVAGGLSQLTTEEQGTVQALRQLQKEVHIDEISSQTQIPLDRLSSVLLQLELKNVVKFLPGRKFQLAVA